MHSKGRVSDGMFGATLHPQSITLAIVYLLLGLAFLLLLMNMTALPAQGQAAQNQVPATARQAAASPAFAQRLHPSPARASAKPAPGHGRRVLPQQVIYSNGMCSVASGGCTTDAWTINFGYVVSDSLTTDGSSPATGFDFVVWAFPGDALSTVDWSITSAEFGGTTYGSGTATATLTTDQGANQYGYEILTYNVPIGNVSLNAGTYWVNMQNAVVANGDPIYWDENGGASLASQSAVGTIPSESFDLTGSTTTITCAGGPISDVPPAAQAKVATVPPSPTQTFKVIYDFTGGADGAYPQTGLAMDADGNLYGTSGTQWYGGYGAVFRLSPGGSGWRFTRLYAFSGPDGDFASTGPVLGPDGRVYATTAGGGAYSRGVLFGLSPSGQVLPSVFSNWTQKLLYSFTGGTDGSSPQGGLLLDDAGNIFGTANRGGENGLGTLYEYTSSGLQVLHAFHGIAQDGYYPRGVIHGKGGLYGITGYGGAYGAGTVYTLAGGYQTLYSFQDGKYEPGSPIDLAADQAGNLFGSSVASYLRGCSPAYGGTLFELTYPDWTLVPLQSWWDLWDFHGTVATDASGNVFGTTYLGYGDLGSVFKLTCCWTYTTLHQFSGPDGEVPLGTVLIDAKGNIYGTTASGGAYGYGTMWEITP